IRELDRDLDRVGYVDAAAVHTDAGAEADLAARPGRTPRAKRAQVDARDRYAAQNTERIADFLTRRREIEVGAAAGRVIPGAAELLAPASHVLGARFPHALVRRLKIEVLGVLQGRVGGRQR